jgi:hypothetical protein
MTSLKQIEANRHNALKSTGPKTPEGKERSRCNAVRHGLTAETVIGALEDAEDYRAFEAAIIADYNAQSAVERELILRLASLLWRLRRATAMETGILQLQAEGLQELNELSQVRPDPQQMVYDTLMARRKMVPERHAPGRQAEDFVLQGNSGFGSRGSADPTRELARCFVHLANIPTGLLERLSRYEATLWRQVGQILFTLDALDRRKPQERRRTLGSSGAWARSDHCG